MNSALQFFLFINFFVFLFITVEFEFLCFFLQKSENATCEDKNDKRELVCKILHPIFKRSEKVLLKHDVTLQLKSLNYFREYIIYIII